MLEADDREALERVWATGAIADGEEIAGFEAELAGLVGRPGAVAVSSGFAALHLALAGLGVGAGDEVIVPCVSTCPAMRNAVWATGAAAVYADINEGDFNLSVESVREAITSRTRAIVAPHHTGIAADIPALEALGVPVIEDCAQALGATWKGRSAGSLGAAAVFSFYATKMATSIDGGAVCTTDGAWLERVRELRYYRHRSDQQMRYNYKMQNVNAAVGRVQLRKLPRLLARRRELAERLGAVAAGAGLEELRREAGAVYFKLAWRLGPGRRERLRAELERRGVPCSTEFDWMTEDRERFPRAREELARVLTLPVYPALTEAEVDFMARGLREALTAAEAEEA